MYSASAQDLYIKAGVGNAFVQGGQLANGSGTPYNGSYTVGSSTIYDTSFNLKKASFSSGVQGILSVGYTLGSHIAVELDLATGFATKTYKADATNILNISGSDRANATLTEQSQLPVMFMPCIVLQSGGKDLKMYTRVGFVIPMSRNIKWEELYVYTSSGQTQEDLTGTLKPTLNIGYTAAIGAKYTINKNFAAWAEFSLVSLNLNADELDIKTHTVNGSTLSNNYPDPGTVIHYVSSGKLSLTQQETYIIPFSNLGINFGLSYYFVK